MAVVSSTTPRPAPKCPPVTETASMVSWRSSSATCRSWSTLSRLRSSGVRMVSRSGVLLNVVTAIFQFCMSEHWSDDRRVAFNRSSKSMGRRCHLHGQKASLRASYCSPIGQRDRRHFPRLSPVPAAFPEHLQALKPGGADGRKSPQKARSSPKLYTKAAAKANPQHSLTVMSRVNTTPKLLTTESRGRFPPGQIGGIFRAGSPGFEFQPGLLPQCRLLGGHDR